MNGLPNDMEKKLEIFTRIANFGENDKFGKNTGKVWTNSNEMTNKATLTITEFSKKSNF